MQVEDISGVGFTSRTSSEKKRQGTVGHSMLGQIIINNQNVLPLMHEVFRKRGRRIRCYILKRCRIRSGGTYHDAVLHGAMLLQRIDKTCNGRSLLTNRNINADTVLSLLVQNGIHRYGCFTGLTISDDQLTLSASNGKHGINGKNSGLKRLGNTLSLYNSGCRLLNRTIFTRMNFRTAVDRLAECIDNTAQIFVTDRNSRLLAGSNHLAAFADRAFFVEQNGTDAVIGNILYHSFYAILKKNDLAVHCTTKSMHRDNSIAGCLYKSDLSFFGRNLKVLCRSPKN